MCIERDKYSYRFCCEQTRERFCHYLLTKKQSVVAMPSLLPIFCLRCHVLRTLTVIAPLRCDGIIVYLDDAIFDWCDVDGVLKKFEALLKRLMECGLRINLEETQFLKTSLDFLGHEVTEGKVRPGKEKIRAVSELSQTGKCA